MGKEGKEKTPKKSKVSEGSEAGVEDDEVGAVPILIAPFAQPLADGKLEKRVLKLVKLASKRKQIKRGVKEVIKAIRKNTKGVCVIAGDISPIDVITPLPVLCEDHDIPYIFVRSKEALGHAGLTKRPTSCMLVLPKPLKGETATDEEGVKYTESFQELQKKVNAVQVAF